MVMMSNVRDGQLISTKWSDKIFNGDNNKNIATLTYQARAREAEAS